jgi:transposase
VDNCGIDLHLKSSEVYVADESGRASERARVPTTEASLQRWFGARAPMRICIEASGRIGTRSALVDKQVEK